MDEKIGNSFFCVLFELKNVKGVECVWGGGGGLHNSTLSKMFSLKSSSNGKYYLLDWTLDSGLDS